MASGVGTSQRELIPRVCEMNRDIFRLRLLDDAVPISIEIVSKSVPGERHHDRIQVNDALGARI